MANAANHLRARVANMESKVREVKVQREVKVAGVGSGHPVLVSLVKVLAARPEKHLGGQLDPREEKECEDRGQDCGGVYPLTTMPIWR